jgi:hypothetical protein
MPTEMEKWSPTQKAIYKTFLGSPLKLWASVGHWWIWHFDLAKYTEKQKPRVSAAAPACSVLAVLACCFTGVFGVLFHGCVWGAGWAWWVHRKAEAAGETQATLAGCLFLPLVHRCPNAYAGIDCCSTYTSGVAGQPGGMKPRCC